MVNWSMSVAATLKKFPWMHPFPIWDQYWRAMLPKECPLPPPGQLVSSLSLSPLSLTAPSPSPPASILTFILTLILTHPHLHPLSHFHIHPHPRRGSHAHFHRHPRLTHLPTHPRGVARVHHACQLAEGFVKRDRFHIRRSCRHGCDAYDYFDWRKEAHTAILIGAEEHVHHFDWRRSEHNPF